MSHSFVKVWIHSIIGTKYNKPTLKPESEKQIYEFISSTLKELGCTVNTINGVDNHIHLLFNLSRTHSLGHIMKHVKGRSSHFINSQNLETTKFEWKTGYAAFGVDYENLDRVFFYIRNQKIHHKRQDFDAELKELERESGD